MTENNFKVQETILKLDKQFKIENTTKLKRQNSVNDNTLLEYCLLRGFAFLICLLFQLKIACRTLKLFVEL